MSRAVIYEKNGGPEVLEIRDVPEPHAGSGEIRVHVGAAGLNFMDVGFTKRPEIAARFGITLPSGFVSDFAGIIDEVGDGVTGFVVGDRVFGGAIAKSAADYVVVKAPSDRLWHTPVGISDKVACTLPVAGMTALAATAAIDVHPGDTVLIGGAAGGVGVFAVQLAKIAGATVIGTASKDTFEFIRQLGAEPVEYGDGLVERVRAIAPGGISAAIDLFGTETAEAALELGVKPERISTIAAGPNPPGGAHVTFAGDVSPDSMKQITDAILESELAVPIAANFPIERIREAATLQASRHAHGKIVITLIHPPYILHTFH